MRFVINVIFPLIAIIFFNGILGYIFNPTGNWTLLYFLWCFVSGFAIGVLSMARYMDTWNRY